MKAKIEIVSHSENDHNVNITEIDEHGLVSYTLARMNFYSLPSGESIEHLRKFLESVGYEVGGNIFWR